MAIARGVVFDMDDTIFLERDYVRSGFRFLCNALEAYQVASAETLFAFLWGEFEQGVRGNALDRLFAAYPELKRHTDLPTLVALYRAHPPDIAPMTEWTALATQLAQRGVPMALISDGPLAMQQAKADALRLAERIQPIVLTGTWGKAFWKPHPRAYETVAATWATPHSNLLYIGDNPKKDFVAPNRLGWSTLRLRLPLQQHVALEPETPEMAAQQEARSWEACAQRIWTFLER